MVWSSVRSHRLRPKIMGFLAFGSGVVVVKLASSDYIQAGVVLHPGRITEDEINGNFHTSKAHNLYLWLKQLVLSEVKCPISILGAEIDNASPPEQMKHFGEILSAKPGVRDSENAIDTMIDAKSLLKLSFKGFEAEARKIFCLGFKPFHCMTTLIN